MVRTVIRTYADGARGPGRLPVDPLLAETLLRRHEAGAAVARLEEEYGLSEKQVKTRLARAREARANGETPQALAETAERAGYPTYHSLAPNPSERAILAHLVAGADGAGVVAASTGELMRAVGVSKTLVLEMLRRLTRRGCIERLPYAHLRETARYRILRATI